MNLLNHSNYSTIMHYEASLGVAYIFHRVYLAKICDEAKRMQQFERLLLNEQYITLLSR